MQFKSERTENIVAKGIILYEMNKFRVSKLRVCSLLTILDSVEEDRLLA